MEESNSTKSSTLQIQVANSSTRHNKVSNECPTHATISITAPSSTTLNATPRDQLLETGSSNISRSNSMRTSRWDESMPKDLEPRPPSRPVRKTISRSLSPRPRKPISLASLRPPPPSPTWSGLHGGVASPPVLLPTRSPTPPQTTG